MSVHPRSHPQPPQDRSPRCNRSIYPWGKAGLSSEPARIPRAHNTAERRLGKEQTTTTSHTEQHFQLS